MLGFDVIVFFFCLTSACSLCELACPTIRKDKADNVAIAFILFYLIYLYKVTGQLERFWLKKIKPIIKNFKPNDIDHQSDYSRSEKRHFSTKFRCL